MAIRPQTRRRLRAAVEELIEDLGPNVTAIADKLTALGVRGRPGDEERCVLNSYLQCVVGADPDVVGVAVRPHAVHVRVAHWRPSVRVPLPLEAQAFIAAFDAGLYPGLVVGSPTEKEEHAPQVGHAS
ncbi:MAG TPA: hypothetical protein VKW77_04800 [Acidimicrobiales bacterium]|nr:hypothetical protein [Acidimicrobiales bacterium]